VAALRERKPGLGWGHMSSTSCMSRCARSKCTAPAPSPSRACARRPPRGGVARQSRILGRRWVAACAAVAAARPRAAGWRTSSARCAGPPACGQPDRTAARKVSLFHASEIDPNDPSQRMRRAIDSPQGRRLYSRRIATVEPVFANLRHNKRLSRFTLRGTNKVRAQWQALLPGAQHREVGAQRMEAVRDGPGPRYPPSVGLGSPQKRPQLRPQWLEMKTLLYQPQSRSTNALTRRRWVIGQLR